MSRKLQEQGLPVCHLEVHKIKTGGDRASDQREIPSSGNLSAEPASSGDDDLEGGPGGEIGAQR